MPHKELLSGPALRAIAVGVRSGEIGVLAGEARRRFHSDWRHLGLARELDVPFEAPDAKVPVTIRKLRSDDVPKLLELNTDQMAPRGPYVRMHRLRFIDEGLGTCWVAALADDDEPCYMQWLISASENDHIQRYFGGIFPVLDDDQALLEYAFTPERFQGKGIMPAAMSRIAEQATEFGARRVVTFVDHQNVAALKGCHRAGFREYIERTDHWRRFRRQSSFSPFSEATSETG